ncbi:hypothetical protein J6590_101192 [Homalodisca vitripennis]|nr:hypothetical protein J6590_101192 [Homalodisca vitripennis]
MQWCIRHLDELSNQTAQVPQLNTMQWCIRHLYPYPIYLNAQGTNRLTRLLRSTCDGTRCSGAKALVSIYLNAQGTNVYQTAQVPTVMEHDAVVHKALVSIPNISLMPKGRTV